MNGPADVMRRIPRGMISVVPVTRAKVGPNLAKGDNARRTLRLCGRNLVDIFYRIRQVVARVANLFLMGAFGTHILEKGGCGGQQ